MTIGLNTSKMTIELSTIKTLAEVIALIVLFYGYFSKVIHFTDKQKELEKEVKDIKDEQSILTYGVLACLKGLKEQGCNGPVTEAISKIEKHLNVKAHE